MPEPRPEQVAAKVIVRERIAPTPTAGSADAMAKDIADKVSQGNWREALKIPTRKETGAKTSSIVEAVDQFGTQRNPDGSKNRDPQEQLRYDESKAAAEFAKKFMEQGHDVMTVPEKTQLQAIVQRVINRNPAYAAEFASANNTQKREFLERILKDPKIAEEVKKALDTATAQKLADAVTPAQDKFDDKDLERQQTEAELTDIRTRISNIDTALDDFRRGPTGVAVGTSAVELDGIKAALPTIQADLLRFGQDLTDAQRRLTRLETERNNATRVTVAGGRPIADIDADITTEETNIRNAQTEIATRQARVARKDELEQAEAKLKDDRKNLEKDEKTKAAEFRKIELEVQRRARELADAKALRSSQEDDLVESFKNVISDAATEVINNQTEQAATLVESGLTELKSKAKTQQEKSMYDALREKTLGGERTRYRGLRVGIGRIGVGGREEVYRPLDRDAIQELYQVYLDDGMDRFMTELLRGTQNPDTGRNYRTAEINTVVGSTSDETKTELAKQLLSRRLLVGGIGVEDLHNIFSRPEGEAIVQGGIKANDEFRKQVESVMGAGAVNSPGFMERFGQEIRNHPWWAILLLGLPFLAVGAATMQAARFNVTR